MPLLSALSCSIILVYHPALTLCPVLLHDASLLELDHFGDADLSLVNS